MKYLLYCNNCYVVSGFAITTMISLHKLGFIYGFVFIEIGCVFCNVKLLVVAQDLQRRLRQVSTKCR